jgi:hypothetical protein
LVPDAATPVGAGRAVLADVELDEEEDGEEEDGEEEEFAPNNVKSSAADKPPKEFNEANMPHLYPPKDSHRRGRIGRLTVMAKYEFDV